MEPVPGRPFPKHVTDVLESFFIRGMTGWSGSIKSALFQEALGSTQLNESQLKVIVGL